MFATILVLYFVAVVMSGREAVLEIFRDVGAGIDGAALVKAGVTDGPAAPGPLPLHVLSVGKVAFPMFEGLRQALGDAAFASGLIIAPAPATPTATAPSSSVAPLPPQVTALLSDHPTPSARSLAAGRAAADFVAGLLASDRLLVLLSGGASAAMVVPAGALTLADKRAATMAAARAGATIAQLNTVRKHLSAIKGGQLALRARARTTVLALSDVVGSDPGTIASGPFSPDPTTYGQALALLERLAPGAPAAALDHLRQGVAGRHPETPKPDDARLNHVSYRVLAGPERVAAEARQSAQRRGFAVGQLARNTEAPVSILATAYGASARHYAGDGNSDGHLILIGNGEPSIVVTGDGRGGRATHLALLMAREMAGLTSVAFLAAGTDDRDGSGDAAGAVVDGTTWDAAVAAGLDPAGALDRCDSEAPLRALGCLARGPGRSNLLDLHLLAIGWN